jgi:hypothetical protein
MSEIAIPADLVDAKVPEVSALRSIQFSRIVGLHPRTAVLESRHGRLSVWHLDNFSGRKKAESLRTKQIFYLA